MFAVIRIRGSVGIRKEIKDTLNMLRLKNVNNCVLVEENDSFKGMLRKVKDYVTWGEINQKILSKLLEKRLRMVGDKKVSKEDLKRITKYESFEDFAKSLIEGRVKLKDFKELKKVFRLRPPKKGFKSIKEAFPKGDLGYRGNEINKLLERMI